MDNEVESTELRIESNAVVTELLHSYDTPEKMMGDFLVWVLPHWNVFWSRFSANGTMSWQHFENFVHWEGHWPGDSRRIFALLDRKNTGVIRKPDVLDTRRKWEYAKDAGYMTIEDFRNRFMDKWGTLGRGWRLALDVEDMGYCCQLKFMRACSELGMHRNLKTLWWKLTQGEVQRNICFRDLDPECDQILKYFSRALAVRHGSIREGWCAICRAGGGHLHQNGFVQACGGLGIPGKAAKILYAVLDPYKTRYLTEYDKLDFLELWTPTAQMAKQPLPERFALKEVKHERSAADALLGNKEEERSSSKAENDLGAFEFRVVLTKDEYTDYLRRTRNLRVAAGFGQVKNLAAADKVGTQRRRLQPPGGTKPRPPSAPPKLQSINDPSSPTGTSGSPSTVDNVWSTLSRSQWGPGTPRAAASPRSLSGFIKTPDL